MKWGKNIFDSAKELVGFKKRPPTFADDVKKIYKEKQGINTDALSLVTNFTPLNVVGGTIMANVIRKFRYDENHLFHPDSTISKVIEAFGDGVRIVSAALDHTIGKFVPQFIKPKEEKGKSWVDKFLAKSKKKVRDWF